MRYTWVPFYQEVAGRVLDYEKRQGELLDVLRDMEAASLPTLPLIDYLPEEKREPLREIDPFTFVANFSRTKDDTARRLCAWLKERWELSAAVPQDFDGRANVDARGGASWFFASTRSGRRAGDIPLLWRLARQAYGAEADRLDDSLYRGALEIPNVAVVKLTTGLFWFSPRGFLPLTGPVLPYLKERGVKSDERALNRGGLSEYRALMSRAHEVNPDNAALAREAWQWKKGRVPEALPSDKTSKSNLPHEPNLPDVPLNLIRYGPPGTGKTYSSIARAVEIVTGKRLEGQAAKAEFDRLRDERRIEFVTFHQSFAYEDFIEGIRPALNEESESGARYELRDGVLKEMALRALGAAHQSRSSRPAFSSIWEKFVDFLEDSDGTIKAVGKGSGLYQVHIEAEKYVRGPNINGKADRDYSVPIATLEKVWQGLKPGEKPASDTIRLIYGDGTPKGFDCNLGGAVLQKLQEIEREMLASAPTADFSNAPRFVLIIDEINRGNISKILGELITLLEKDKRLGADNELRVRLPISGETFGLPSNLYVLGTMNTADKSLAMLDIALRRRFSFEEVRPDFTICAGLTDEMRRALNALNQRLMLVLDREHRLGHAFFIGVDSPKRFNDVFESEIVPLLQEFFYNDWDGLRAVLNETAKPDAAGRIVRTLANPDGLQGHTRYAWWYDVGDATPDFLAALSTGPVAAPANNTANDA